MSVSVKKIAGVESVHVYLNKGLVDITLKPGNTVKLAQLRKAIRDDAFTPKQARVTVIGKLFHEGGRLEFKVAGTNEEFPVRSTTQKSWQTQVGRELTVKGLISAPVNHEGPGVLQITSVF